MRVHFGPSTAPGSINVPVRDVTALFYPNNLDGYIAADCYFAAGAPADCYLAAGAPQDEAHLVAEDFYASAPWITDKTGNTQNRLYCYRRELYKNGQLYGIRREWYPTGGLSSETPFKNGLLDGTVKYWNPWGQLIGQYEIKAGSGKRRLYYDNGQLQVEDELKNNRLNGQKLQFYPDGQLKSVWHFKDDELQGISFGLNAQGSIDYVECENGPAISLIHGPNYPPNSQGSFYESIGGQQIVEWHLNNQIVSESEYAAAAAKNPHLPPYFKDTSRYFSHFAPQAKAQAAKYRALPHVLIPLLLDEKGNALPAPASSPAKTPITLGAPVVSTPVMINADERAQLLWKEAHEEHDLSYLLHGPHPSILDNLQF